MKSTRISKPRSGTRHNVQAGWNAANDPEWQYRKTLTMSDRVAFDSLSDEQRGSYVTRWLRGQATTP